VAQKSYTHWLYRLSGLGVQCSNIFNLSSQSRWQFRASRLTLKRFGFAIDGHTGEALPCSCQGSSPYRSADWLWPPAHSLKPPQSPQRHARRPKLLSKSIQTGIQSENPTGHVRQVLHLAGGELALAAP
jgi:hypothetical protein